MRISKIEEKKCKIVETEKTKEISGGKEMAEGKIRIKDIAKIAGVSATTVSNVIHGRTEKVSRKRIITAALICRLKVLSLKKVLLSN